jgi:hypothetical protein
MGYELRVMGCGLRVADCGFFRFGILDLGLRILIRKISYFIPLLRAEC